MDRTLFVNLGDLLAGSHQAGSTVVITASTGDTLTLLNTTLTNLHANDFTFV